MLAPFNHSYPRRVSLHHIRFSVVAPHTPFFVITLILAHLITLTSFISFPFWSSQLTEHTTHSRNPLFIHHSSSPSFQSPSFHHSPSYPLLLSHSSLPNPYSTNTPYFPLSQKRPFLPEYPVDNTSWNWFGFNMAFAADSKKESTIFIKNLPLDITTSVFYVVGLNNGIATRKRARWIRSRSSCDYRQGLDLSVLMIVHRIRRECLAALATWNCGGWSRHSFLV